MNSWTLNLKTCAFLYHKIDSLVYFIVAIISLFCNVFSDSGTCFICSTKEARSVDSIRCEYFFNYHFYHLPKSVQSFDSCVTRSTAIEMTSLKLVSWLGVNFSSSSLELEFDVSFARILSLVVLRSYFSAQFRFDLLIELTLGQMKHSRQNTGQVWLEGINYAASVSQTVGGNGLIHSNYDRLEMWYKFKELHFFFFYPDDFRLFIEQLFII